MYSYKRGLLNGKRVKQMECGLPRTQWDPTAILWVWHSPKPSPDKARRSEMLNHPHFSKISRLLPTLEPFPS